MKSKNMWLFAGLTMLTSWILWLPLVLQTRGYLTGLPDLSALKVLGALTPAVFGIVMTVKEGGKASVKALVKNSFTRVVSVPWLIAVCVLPFAFNFAARAAFGAFETNLPKSDTVTGVASLIYFSAMVFLFGGGLDEEIGWRGYLTDRLLKRTRPIHAVWITSIVWTVWHLPLFYIAGTNQAQVTFFEFALPVAALTVIVTWIYFRTKSVLLCALFHTFGNVAHEVFKVVPTADAGNPLGFYIYTGIMIAVAALILTVDVRLYKKNDILS